MCATEYIVEIDDQGVRRCIKKVHGNTLRAE